VKVDGTCPSCGRVVDPGHAHASAIDLPVEVPADAPADADGDEPLDPIPWHLKLLAGALALYLGYRAWQGIEWIAHRF
jgi:hypothetical protein